MYGNRGGGVASRRVSTSDATVPTGPAPLRVTPPAGRIAAIDGLRGIAALSVVVAHLAANWGVLPWAPAGGGMGVLVFFGLSGYLIARICLRFVGGGAPAYSRFVRRRVVRLAPAVTVVSILVPLGLWLDGMAADQAFGQFAQTLGQASGLATAFGWDVHQSLGHTWSLTTEWIFYLLFPAVVLLATRRRPRPGLLTGGALSAALVLYLAAMPLSAAHFFYLPVANLAVMSVGAALAFAQGEAWSGPDIVTTGPAPYFALAMILTLVFLPGNGGSWGYRLSVLPATCLCTMVILHALHHGHPIARVLAWGPLQGTGLRAYSLYLWHLPLMWLIWRMLGDQGLGWMLLVFIPAIGAATLASFAVLERPVLRNVPSARHLDRSAPAAHRVATAAEPGD